jgi:hypothetical protein
LRNSFLTILVISGLAVISFAQQPPAATSIDPPGGAKVLLQLHGEGVQIYTCTLDNTTLNWKFQGPEAKLTNIDGTDAGTHYAGPTWKLRDGSEAKGSLVGTRPAPESGAMPWLLLKIVRHAGDGKLGNAEYITRTDTKGGVAPASGCDSAHKGEQTRVPYSATYTFYGK